MPALICLMLLFSSAGSLKCQIFLLKCQLCLLKCWFCLLKCRLLGIKCRLSKKMLQRKNQHFWERLSELCLQQYSPIRFSLSARCSSGDGGGSKRYSLTSFSEGTGSQNRFYEEEGGNIKKVPAQNSFQNKTPCEAPPPNNSSENCQSYPANHRKFRGGQTCNN